VLYSGSHRNTLGVAVVVVAAAEVDMVLVFAGAFPLLMDAMVVAGGASELQVFVDVGNWLGAQVRGGAGVEDSVIVVVFLLVLGSSLLQSMVWATLLVALVFLETFRVALLVVRG
jgi:hypothetical protein